MQIRRHREKPMPRRHLTSVSGLAAACLALGGASVTAAAPAPEATTLDALRAEPARFAGKKVRLRGQFDQCYNFDCALCPEEATRAAPQANRCLALSFDRQAGSAIARGADFDPVYRYATVDLVARFDPTCLEGLCTDRASVLRDARVRRVILRRTSAEGLNSRRERNRLVEAPPAVTAAVIPLLHEDGEAGEGGPRYRAFVSRAPADAAHGAVLCRSSGRDSDPATWPADFVSAIFARSTEDRFRCYYVRQRGGKWLLQPD
jgi:hypothetical protein